MTTHSVCHPGRPAPHGDGHDGSPGFAFFQRAKSTGDALLLVRPRPGPRLAASSSGWRASRP